MSEGNQLKRAASADSGSEAQHRSKNACVRDAQEGTDEAKGTCCSAPDKTGSPQGGQVVELAAFVNATSCAAGAPLRSVESTGDPHGDDSEPDSPRLNLLVGSVPEPAGDLDALLLGPGVDTSAPRLDQDAPLGGPDTTSEALMQDGEQSAVNQQQEVDMHVESAGQVVGGRAAPAVPSEELPLQSCQVVAHTTTAADAAATDPAAGPVLEDAGPTPADAGAAAPVAAAASPDAAAAVTPAAAADDDGTGPAHDDDNDASVENDDHDNDDGNGEDDEAAKAHAYSALLADLHQAAWAQRFPSRLQWAALIAPNRPWDTCPGPDQCSIVLDTETSGLPRNFNGWTYTRHQCLGAYDTCRIVSVAWQVLGPPPGLQPLHQGYLLVRRDGWDIDQEAIKIHGITNEVSDQEGIPIDEALSQLMKAVRRCHVMVGHNLAFDFHLILNELYRLGRFDDVSYVEAMATYCTMKQAVKLLDGRDVGGMKLGDALARLTREKLGAAAHHAAADVEACRKVYEKLLERRWAQEAAAAAAGAAAGDEAAAAGAP